MAEKEISTRKRLLLDIIIIGCPIIGIMLTGTYLAYYNFILMPLAGAATVFRLRKYWVAVPLIIALITYWVTAFKNVADGALFYCLLYFVLAGIGIIIGSLIFVAYCKEPCGIAKKVILTLIAAAISIVMIVSAFQYVGNPFTTAKAGVAIKAYVAETYPEAGYTVSDPAYDFSTKDYFCSVFDSEGTYLFDVLYKGGEMQEDYSMARQAAQTPAE